MQRFWSRFYIVILGITFFPIFFQHQFNFFNFYLDFCFPFLFGLLFPFLHKSRSDLGFLPSFHEMRWILIKLKSNDVDSRILNTVNYLLKKTLKIKYWMNSLPDIYSVYLSERHGAPVLIWPVPSPTTRSAIKQSSVSPDRWDTMVPQPEK